MGTKATLALLLCLASSGEGFAAATAQVTSSPAKGETKCVIKQHRSEYLTTQHEIAKMRAGIPFYMQTMSYLNFRVLKSGALLVGMNEDTYPGSTFYFMINGKRYSGRASYYIQLDTAALSALRKDELIDFTYTHWPNRNEISRKDIFSGFSIAYDECLLAFGKRPKRAAPVTTIAPANEDGEETEAKPKN